MATIQKMAKQYGKVNYIVRYTADGDKEIDEDTCAEAFEDGANAVLEEIETFVRINCWNSEDKEAIFSKIKELKGE